MDTQAWLEYFTINENRATAHVPARLDVPEHLRDPLVHALRLFQAGETGEGRIVHESRRAVPRDRAFQESMRLYIAEEGRHARELGQLVRALHGGAAVTPPGDARAFTFARRALGYWPKMAILTAAEVVGIVFYDLLAERIPCAELASVVATISSEERAHLALQRDTFEALAARAPAGAPRAATALLATGLVAATVTSVAVFAVEIRDLLSKLDVAPRELALRTARVLDAVSKTPSEDVVEACLARARAAAVEERPARSAAPFGWLGAA
jgi:hypothetical protein